VARHLAHLVQGPVTRHELPGIGAFNFVCEAALGGGGMASMRADALGKGLAQVLLAMPVRVPQAWAAAAGHDRPPTPTRTGAPWQISMSSASLTPCTTMLRNLDHILARGEAFAAARKVDPLVLTGDRLAPDMFPLRRQVQIACDAANRAGAAVGRGGAEVRGHRDGLR
jgi:hypothetical protein